LQRDRLGHLDRRDHRDYKAHQGQKAHRGHRVLPAPIQQFPVQQDQKAIPDRQDQRDQLVLIQRFLGQRGHRVIPDQLDRLDHRDYRVLIQRFPVRKDRPAQLDLQELKGRREYRDHKVCLDLPDQLVQPGLKGQREILEAPDRQEQPG
jgi:hypothetical protein